MPTVTITGGTGMIGTAICKKLTTLGYNVVILGRESGVGKINELNATGNINHCKWDLNEQTIDPTAISNADYIIHLAGAGVADKRWTEKRKQEIIDSRVKGCQLIAKSLLEIPNNVQAVICASAIGWYGPDQPGKIFNESDPPADDFLGRTCKLWEQSADEISKAGPRVVKLRTGIVLSRKGGALKEFLKPMRFGIAPVMGNGKQVMSWIHIDDLVDLYLYALKNESMIGSYNAVSPNPLSNKDFIKAIAKARKGLSLQVKIPGFLLKTILGEMSIEVLKSCTVNSDKIRKAGFHFRFDNISPALEELILQN